MKVDTNFAESRTQKAANREIFGGALGRKMSESVSQSRKGIGGFLYFIVFWAGFYSVIFGLAFFTVTFGLDPKVYRMRSSCQARG